MTLSITTICRYAECPDAEYRYVECHYAECQYAESHYAECCYAGCGGAILGTLHQLLYIKIVI
jgi:hypothetical protein